MICGSVVDGHIWATYTGRGSCVGIMGLCGMLCELDAAAGGVGLRVSSSAR